MQKIAINTGYGGFGLSHKAMLRYAELAGLKLSFKVDNLSRLHYGDDPNHKHNSVSYRRITEDGERFFCDDDICRSDKHLIQVIEELGKEANGHSAKLKIVEIPDDVEWQIGEYEDTETVEEKHRCWS